MLGYTSREDAFRSHWLALPAELFLTDHEPHEAPVAIELRTGEQPTIIETVDGQVRARPGTAEAPDLVLSGAPQLIIGLLSGRLSIAAARRDGLECVGDVKALRRIRTRGSAASERGAALAGAA